MAEAAISDNSTNKLHVQNVEFKWKISDFRLRAKSGISINSATFPSNGKNNHMWFMVCSFKEGIYYEDPLDNIYPDMEIHLKMRKPYPNPKTDFTVFSLQHDEKKYPKIEPQRFAPGTADSFSLGDPSDLMKSLPIDEITIVAKLQICTSPYNTNSYASVVKVPQKNLREKLCRLLLSKAFSDVVLLADGIEFPAHKNILAARSPVFEAMFNHNMMETQTSKVEIEDISAEVVKGMLYFIYSDETPPKLDGMSQEMILVAEKYDLPRLKAMCEQNLESKLSDKNALEILVLADKLSAVQLKKAALEAVNKSK